jgi:uncharacterized membrane protein HdeD (DUF308 family)
MIMSEERQPAPVLMPTALYGDLQKNWGWLLALGIFLVTLGTIGLGMSFALTLASVLLFGVLLLIAGGAQLFDAVKCKGWKGILWHILIALLYLFAGITIISDPLVASSLLTLMIAGAFVGVGLVRLIMAFQHRGSPGWFWLLLGGIVAIVLGIVIMARWPVSGFWVIGLFVAIEMIFSGWAYVFVALAARKGAAGSEEGTGTGTATA